MFCFFFSLIKMQKQFAFCFFFFVWMDCLNFPLSFLHRFLKPSQVHGIDTEAFMRQQQIATNLHEQSILGYRGLTGKEQKTVGKCGRFLLFLFQFIEFIALTFFSFSRQKKKKLSTQMVCCSDDRMKILQRFQPHCHFTNFEEVVIYLKSFLHLFVCCKLFNIIFYLYLD